MNWHEIMDERALEMDAVIARELRDNPAKLELVVAWIQRFLADPDYSTHSKEALTEWLNLIRARGLSGVLSALADRSEQGIRMRQNSPFAVLMPQAERRKILAKYEARRPRAHPASV
ncbi:MAG: hypothetical protein HS113_23120 [Verrucomicrobiales bacterium]|nr:hypothetical protein [Verrucomicrobiales bacterium]